MRRGSARSPWSVRSVRPLALGALSAGLALLGAGCRETISCADHTSALCPDSGVVAPDALDALDARAVDAPGLDAPSAPDACTPSTFYADDDGDAHGDPARPIVACAQPPLTATSDDDCDDTLDTVHPGAPENCDGVDEDCDGSFDDGVGKHADFYPDADGDDHGAVGGTPVDACAAPEGYAGTADDCDDTMATVFPGATETCNGLDDDCDAGADEGIQRLVGTPREIAGFGAVREEMSHAATVGDGYAVLWNGPSGVMVERVGPTGAVLNRATVLSNQFGSFVRLVPTTALAAVALHVRSEGGGVNALYASVVDFAADPPTIGARVEVARGSGVFFDTTTAAVAGDRVVVLYEPSPSRVEGRTFATDLSSPSPAVTLHTFGIGGMSLMPGADDATLVLHYDAQRPIGDTFENAYLDRIVASPLSLEARAFNLSDRTGENNAIVTMQPDGHGIALVGYGGTRFETVRFARGTFGSDPTISSRSPLVIGDPLAFAIPHVMASAAGADLALAVSPGTPPSAVQWRHIAASGGESAPARFGGAQFIVNMTGARLSSRQGALFWVATATGDTRQQLLMQSIGCE